MLLKVEYTDLYLLNDLSYIIFLQISFILVLDSSLNLRLFIFSFPSLLSNAMSATQSSILKISAMHSLDTLRANENNIKKPIETNTTTFVTSSSVFITNYIVPHLPNLISNLLECLSTFGEPVLDVGLCGLYKLLCVDLNQFTQSIITQIIPIMVGLFKHCFGGKVSLVFSPFEIVCVMFLDIFRDVNRRHVSNSPVSIQIIKFSLLISYSDQNLKSLDLSGNTFWLPRSTLR